MTSWQNQNKIVTFYGNITSSWLADFGLDYFSELTYFNIVRLRATGMPLLAVLFRSFESDQINEE